MTTNHPALCNWLLEHGADPNVKDEFHDTPVSNAACWGSLAMLDLLFQYGAKIDNNALHMAIKRKKDPEKKRILMWLLGHGADINALGKCGT